MEENNITIYALYEGDAWLSCDSLVCMGVFDEDHIDMASEELIRERQDELFKEYLSDNGYDGKSLLRYCNENGIEREKGESKEHLYERLRDDFVDELKEDLLNNNQTQGYETNFLIKVLTLNEYGEI